MGFRGSSQLRASPSTEASNQQQLREEIVVDLIPGNHQSGDELAVFDVVVKGAGLIGRWQCTKNRAWVTWTDGSEFETAPCNDDRKQIATAIRPHVPLAAVLGHDFNPSASPALTHREQ